MPPTEPDLLRAIAEGTLSFAYGVEVWLFGLLAVLIIAGVWLSYLKTTRPLTRPWKAFFVLIRSSVLILLLFCLLRPVVTTLQVVPQETWLAVLVDDSMSMSIRDGAAGQSRSEAAEARFFGDGGLLAELADSFQIRSFRFARETGRLEDVGGLTGTGTASGMDQALEYVDSQLNGLPLGGLLLISDGADNSAIDPVIRARDFGNRRIPIFSVGVGQEEIPRDVAIVDVSAARTVLEGSVFTVQAGIHQQGYEDRQVRLSISDGGVEVASRTVALGNGGVTRRFELELTPERPELIVYDLEVELQDGELIAENNRYSFLVDNTDKAALDVLYIEGHPRNEYKFIRRAVEGDDSLRLATYLQTGPEKFYRQGIRSPTELSEGFPRDKETLYQYEAIILGDIEAAFFSPEQLQMIQDFVAERGGGFLMSGMVDAEFIGTPVADVLPMTLVEDNFLPGHLRGGIRRGNHPTGELYFPRLTGNGELSPLLRLGGEDLANRERWRQLPQLQGIHVTGGIKPGATVLIEHPLLSYRNQPLPVLAMQRYGSGRSMAVTTASTWRWQMMMPAADQSHESIWRQLLRWLVVSAPQRVTIQFDQEFYHVGDEVNVTATVLDDRYEPNNDATLWMQTTDPLDRNSETPMEWDIERDGVYRAAFTATEEGVFSVLVDVTSAAADATVDSAEQRAAFVVTPSLREYSNAELNQGLLGRIADASGGSYFSLADAGALVDAVEFTPNAWSREVQIDLWDRPWLLTLLIVLLCLDWITRRLKGLS